MPVGAERDDLLVEAQRDAAAHRDDHARTEQRLTPLLPVLDNVPGNEV